MAVASGAIVKDLRDGRSVATSVVADASLLPENLIPGGIDASPLDEPDDAAMQFLKYERQIGEPRIPRPAWLEKIRNKKETES